MNGIIAAIDLGSSSPRVLYHAAGFARLLSCGLRVLHVNGASVQSRARVREYCRQQMAYEVDVEDEDIVVRSGLVSDAIVREAIREQARMIVVGSSARGGLGKLMLGSTSDAVLRSATVPVLVVPPAEFDIVDISDRPALTSGPILAAVDLDDGCDRHLQFAAELSRLSRQHLDLLTVARQRVNDQVAAEKLRERAHSLEPRPHALIVRRGDVGTEISRCAVSEGAGLVVLGVRPRSRGNPGAIASAILKSRRAFVLTIPGRSVEQLSA
ncbi:MAG TPA: universal stress protein [Vicinamibacterales bacterium]|jgi:nucleotide-binding universal stress UspA family protein